ncbi:MAG: FAD-dependent oxidoreductase [Parvibaculaceae bacterium]|nr:FAD-dependent oxidoreductase [Parvibaculaceae bacterium]
MTEVKPKLVVIGNGMASVRFLEELTEQEHGYDITVFGEEPEPAYNRVLLSSCLAGDISTDDIQMRGREWYAAHNINLTTGETVTQINPQASTIDLASGPSLPYDQLVIATGSRPICLPLPGADLEGVVTFRDLKDLSALHEVQPDEPVVVIGGGLLGLEAAAGLAGHGADVTVVHLMDKLMERQLDAPAAKLLKSSLEAKNINVELCAESDYLRENQETGKVDALVLKDGRALPASLVIMAVGISPNVGLAKSAGVTVSRGIEVNDQMQTSIPNIYAVGECAQHRGTCYGLVEPAYEQVKVLAAHLTNEIASYEGTYLATNLKVNSVSVFSAGRFEETSETEAVSYTDPNSGTYRKLLIENEALIGAVLIGDTQDGIWYRNLIQTGQKISSIRSDLIFGETLANQKVKMGEQRL